MSVPPDRMAVRPAGNPNKIMGLPKWAFWIIIAAGLLLAYYLYKHSQNTSALDNAAAGTTEGVTAADIGGTPADNSFATVTDQDALEQQIQQLQDSLSQLQAANGGNGAGLPGPGSSGTPVPGNLGGGGIPPINPGGPNIPTPAGPGQSGTPVSGNLGGGGTATSTTTIPTNLITSTEGQGNSYPPIGVGAPGGVRAPGGTQTQ